jgi:hypothetical protein
MKQKNERKSEGNKKKNGNKYSNTAQKIIPKHGHLSRLLSQRRASCQEPQEPDMLVSSTA